MENISDNKLNIDISDYWIILKKRLVFILLIFVAFLCLAVVYTVRQSPVYQASCKMKISSRQPMATIEGAQISWYGARGNELGSEIKLMSNKDQIFREILDIFKNRVKHKPLTTINEDKEYYSPEDIKYIENLTFSSAAEDYINSINDIAAFKGLYKIEPVTGSDIVEIQALTPYPDLCVALSNVMGIVYRADFWKTKTLDAKETMKFIEGQLDHLKQELGKDKLGLEESSKEKTNIGSPEVYKEELTKLRLELDRMKEKYKDKHPKIVKQKNMIKAIEDQLAQLPKTEIKYSDKQAEWELKNELRKNLGEYYQKAKIDYEAKLVKTKDEIMIISKARHAGKLKPNEVMNISAGAMLGAIVACLLALVLEGLDTSIGKIEDVERITRLPVIAHIPVIGRKTKNSSFFRPAIAIWRCFVKIIFFFFPFLEKEDDSEMEKNLIVNLDKLSLEAEAYRTLRTNIHFAMGISKKEGNVIQITSSSPREGKSITSTNLAIEIARMGRPVLLIEADMRRPKISDLFKIERKPGLSDLIIETATKESAIRTFTDILMGNSKWDKFIEIQGLDNLNILPSGTIPPNPTELLLSNEFKKLIDDFRKSYDFIIVDTPPILPVSDPAIISTVVNGVVLVYQSDKTSRHLLSRAIQILQKSHANLLGIVINQLSFDVIMKAHKTQYDYSTYATEEEKK